MVELKLVLIAHAPPQLVELMLAGIASTLVATVNQYLVAPLTGVQLNTGEVETPAELLKGLTSVGAGSVRAGVGATTVKGKTFEVPPPFGFVTRTVQVSGVSCVVIAIRNCVLLTKATCAPESVADPPVQVTSSVGGFTKPMPLMITGCGVLEPATGFGLTLVILSAGGAPLIVRLRPFEVWPPGPFWTATV